MKWLRPGLAGAADDVDETALAVAPLDEVTNDVAALINYVRPSLVISYDSGGGYGHPDHVRTRDGALAGSGSCGTTFAEIMPHRDKTLPAVTRIPSGSSSTGTSTPCRWRFGATQAK